MMILFFCLSNLLLVEHEAGRAERTLIMCTINLKNASQKIMLATAVKCEIKNWQSYKEFILEKEFANATQAAERIDKKIADYKELLGLLEEQEV